MRKVNGRTCLCCRKVSEKENLFRFTSKEGQLVLNPSGGRGYYLHKDANCIKKAFLKGSLRRLGQLKENETMKKLIESLCPSLRFLGLLNKGGKLVFGAALEKACKKASLLILASDAKESTKKLYQNAEVLVGFDKASLGASLGYEEISAVGIFDKKAAKAFLEKYEKEGR